jgi:hypothetical protein
MAVFLKKESTIGEENMWYMQPMNMVNVQTKMLG